MITLPTISSFAELEAWLREIPGQMTGIPTAVCQTGERYVEFREEMLARPADAKVVCWAAYKHYEKWCKEAGLAAATFPAFDFELAELGVKKVNEGRGSFYMEVEL